jgi:hypothetical protein
MSAWGTEELLYMKFLSSEFALSTSCCTQHFLFTTRLNYLILE